ncbi:hypothetical protein ABW19_dt0200600 [Dactylella cylindrospora]|nr:hypothetical protein ABW19_dt0200600 [Dactylella cylindrospora]
MTKANAVNEVSADLVIELAAMFKDAKLSQMIELAGLKPGINISLDASTPLSDIKVDEFIEVLKKNLEARILARDDRIKAESGVSSQGNTKLPTWFGYPYSRHSSFSELQDLVKALAPKDVYPCVAAEGSWYQKDSIRKLFGKYCSGNKFAFDIERNLDIEYFRQRQRAEEDRQLAERQAAGMEDSQQANSQFLQHSSQDSHGSRHSQKSLHLYQGETQADAEHLSPALDHHLRHIQGDTQPDATDPDIEAKVKKAISDARALTESIRVSDSRIQVVRTPEDKSTSRGPKSMEVHLSPTTGLYRPLNPKKRPQSQVEGLEDVSHVSDTRFKNLSSTLSTEPDVDDEAGEGGLENHFNKDSMDCSQDSFGSVGDLDREKVRSVIRAVDGGRWIEKSKDLEFHKAWRYQKEEEL